MLSDMKKRQSSLYENQAGDTRPAPDSTAPAAPPQTPPSKRNWLKLGGIALVLYATLGEFFLPEPIRFTTIIAERGKNIQNIMNEGTADSQAVVACKQQRAALAQQTYVQCNLDRSKTGPTCEFFRDDILNSPCE